MVPPKLRGPNPLGSTQNKRGNGTGKGMKEPKAKRRKREAIPEAEEEEEELTENEEFLEIMKSFFKIPCRMYRISALHKVVGVENFTRWERRLSVALQEKCKHQASKEDFNYQVKIKKITHLKAQDGDGESIYFHVRRKSSSLDNEDENDTWKTLLQGLITCRGSRKSVKNQLSNSPVLLIQGPEGVFSSMKPELEDIFSCYIVPLKSLSPLSLKLIFGRWLFHAKKDKLLATNTKVDIEFCVNIKEKLIKYEATVPMWYFDSAIREEESSTKLNILTMWYQVFDSLETDSIRTSFHTCISKIKSPTMRIAKEGVLRAKVTSEGSLLELLSCLTWVVEDESFSRTLKAQKEDIASS